MSIQLTAIAGAGGTWQVVSDGQAVGTWQRTEHGAVLDDPGGTRLATITAVGGGSPCAVVAGEGAQAGRWSDLAHKILAGYCEIAACASRERCPGCGAELAGWHDDSSDLCEPCQGKAQA
jgi:hypothetical protein